MNLGIKIYEKGVIPKWISTCRTYINMINSESLYIFSSIILTVEKKMCKIAHCDLTSNK